MQEKAPLWREVFLEEELLPEELVEVPLVVEDQLAVEDLPWACREQLVVHHERQ